MKSLTSQLRLVAVAAITSAFTACGGGDDGGSPTGQQAPAVSISATNALAVSAEAIDTGFGGLGGSLALLTGVQITATEAPHASVLEGLASSVKLALKVRGPKVLVGVTVSETEQCPRGGTVDVTSDFASEAKTTVGDTVKAIFRNCVVAAGTTANGELFVRAVEVSADEKRIVADVIATQFVATVDANTGRLNGSLRVVFDDTSSASTRLGITGSFTAERLTGSNVRSTRTASNYRLDLVSTTATGSTAATFAYSLSGTFPNLGTVSFDVATTQAFVTPSGATRPTSGVAKVSGANNSSVIVTVVSGGVRLDIDANGDGTAETTQTHTWAQLEAQL